MSGTFWLQEPRPNAVPYRLFITKTKPPRVVAAIVFGDDKEYYLAFTREVQAIMKEKILASPYIDRSRKKALYFRYAGRRILATGWRIVTPTRADLDLFTEEVRALVEAGLELPLSVRLLRSKELAKEIEKQMTREERRIVQLVPIDVPTEVLEWAEEEERGLEN